MSHFKKHFFVCTNERGQGSRPSCGQRGAQAVLATLQSGIAKNSACWDSVAVTATGCLGPCFHGPMVVAYPEGVWYAGVDAASAEKIVEEHMVGGRPVAALEFDWSDDDAET